MKAKAQEMEYERERESKWEWESREEKEGDRNTSGKKARRGKGGKLDIKQESGRTEAD